MNDSPAPTTASRARAPGPVWRTPSAPWMPLWLCLSACATKPPPPTSAPLPAPDAIVLHARAAPPLALTLSQTADDALTARLAPAAAPGVTAVELRDFSRQTHGAAALDAASPTDAGRTFALPVPWNGELRLTGPPAPGERASSRFVGVVIQPVLPRAADNRPRIIQGPSGRTILILTEAGAPVVGTQVIISSPALSAPAAPAGTLGDTVEIGLLPAPAGRPTAVIGVVPWSPPVKARLTLNVFDPATKAWAAVPTHVAHDGTVFGRAALPGIFAVTVAP